MKTIGNVSVLRDAEIAGMVGGSVAQVAQYGAVIGSYMNGVVGTTYGLAVGAIVGEIGSWF